MRKSHACVCRREVHEMRLGMTFMAHWNADTEFASSVNHTTTPNSPIPKKKGKKVEKKMEKISSEARVESRLPQVSLTQCRGGV